jgi:hypothetical protein
MNHQQEWKQAIEERISRLERANQDLKRGWNIQLRELQRVGAVQHDQLGENPRGMFGSMCTRDFEMRDELHH